MTCPNCGNRVPGTDNFCDRCGTAVARPDEGIFLQPGPAGAAVDQEWGPGLAQPFAAPQEIPVRSVGAPPGGPPRYDARIPGPIPFVLAMDEHVLKTYQAVQLRTRFFKSKRGEGALYVTDARVVFSALVYPRREQRESRLFQQTKLEDISGVSAHISRGVSLLALLLSTGFSVAAIVCLIAATRVPGFIAGFFIFGLIAGGCIVWLVSSAKRRGDVGVAIHSRENGLSPIAFGHDASTRSLGRGGMALVVLVCVIFPPLIIFALIFFGLRPYTVWDVVLGDPAEDTDRLISELGALILDLQTRGKLAFTHWGLAPPDAAPGTDGYGR